MNKFIKLIGIAATLLFTNSSFAGVFFCAFQVGDAPGEPYNRELCLKIEKQCVPSTFTKMFKEREFTIIGKVNDKTGGFETGVMASNNSKQFDVAFNASRIKVSAEYIAQNQIEGVEPRLQLATQLNAAMCESTKRFANSYLANKIGK